MSDKSEISINNNNFEVFNINKYQIDHLPYSLRVLMENYLRNESDNENFNSIVEIDFISSCAKPLMKKKLSKKRLKSFFILFILQLTDKLQLFFVSLFF